MVQDVFLHVFKGLNGFKGLCSERTWIYKITKNKLSDFYRKQYSQKVELIEMNNQIAECLGDPKQNVDEFLEQTFESQLVRDCLKSLPQQYKITLILKYVDGQSIKQIGELSHKTPKAVESMIQRAKNAFIKQYEILQEKE